MRKVWDVAVLMANTVIFALIGVMVAEIVWYGVMFPPFLDKFSIFFMAGIAITLKWFACKQTQPISASVCEAFRVGRGNGFICVGRRRNSTAPFLSYLFCSTKLRMLRKSPKPANVVPHTQLIAQTPHNSSKDPSLFLFLNVPFFPNKPLYFHFVSSQRMHP